VACSWPAASQRHGSGSAAFQRGQRGRGLNRSRDSRGSQHRTTEPHGPSGKARRQPSPPRARWDRTGTANENDITRHQSAEHDAARGAAAQQLFYAARYARAIFLRARRCGRAFVLLAVLAANGPGTQLPYACAAPAAIAEQCPRASLRPADDGRLVLSLHSRSRSCTACYSSAGPSLPAYRRPSRTRRRATPSAQLAMLLHARLRPPRRTPTKAQRQTTPFFHGARRASEHASTASPWCSTTPFSASSSHCPYTRQQCAWASPPLQ
jgi:hypothetical protein